MSYLDSLADFAKDAPDLTLPLREHLAWIVNKSRFMEVYCPSCRADVEHHRSEIHQTLAMGRSPIGGSVTIVDSYLASERTALTIADKYLSSCIYLSQVLWKRVAMFLPDLAPSLDGMRQGLNITGDTDAAFVEDAARVHAAAAVKLAAEELRIAQGQSPVPSSQPRTMADILAAFRKLHATPSSSRCDVFGWKAGPDGRARMDMESVKQWRKTRKGHEGGTYGFMGNVTVERDGEVMTWHFMADYDTKERTECDLLMREAGALLPVSVLESLGIIHDQGAGAVWAYFLSRTLEYTPFLGVSQYELKQTPTSPTTENWPGLPDGSPIPDHPWQAMMLANPARASIIAIEKAGLVNGGSAETPPPTVASPATPMEIGKGKTWQEIKPLAERYVKRLSYPGLNSLADHLECSPSTLSKAIKESPMLRAAKAVHEQKTAKKVPFTDEMIDSTEQTTEAEPLAALIAEQAKEERADERMAARARRRVRKCAR